MSSHCLEYFSVRKSTIFIPPISFPPKQETKIPLKLFFLSPFKTAVVAGPCGTSV